MQRIHNLRNRMREICSSGTVGKRGENDPLDPEISELVNWRVKRVSSWQ
jgi:hypothetical protein